MSADTGPRKRNKDKKRKKGSSGDVNVALINPLREGRPLKLVMDEAIHVQKEANFGGSCCSKLIFIGFSILLVGFLYYALSNLSLYKNNPEIDEDTSWIPSFLSLNFFSEEESPKQPFEEPSIDLESESNFIDTVWNFVLFGSQNLPPKSSPEILELDNISETEESSEINENEEFNEKRNQEADDDKIDLPEIDKNDDSDDNETEEDDQDEDNDDNVTEEDDQDKVNDNNKTEEDDQDNDDDINKYDKDSSNESENEPKRGRYGFYYYPNNQEIKLNMKDDSEEIKFDRKSESEENDSTEDDDSKENDKEEENVNYLSYEGMMKYEINDKNDPDENSENGAREKIDSGEKFDYELSSDGTEKDDSEEDSSEEQLEQESEPKLEELEEESKVEEAENDSGNMITKLSIGTALIFVAYSVIIRKWNNYVNQAAENPEEILRNMINEEQNQIVEDVAQAVFDNVLDYVNDKQENITLQEYLETPSQSESENSDNLVDWRAQGSNIPLHSEESGNTTSDPESEIDFEPQAQEYLRANITNQYDWRQKQELDDADDDLDQGKIHSALEKYEKIIQNRPKSVRAKYGIAKCLDKEAELQKSNTLLAKVIQTYVEALQMADVPEELTKLIAERVIDRMRFKGDYISSIPLQETLIEQYPNEVAYQNELAVSYLILNRISEAKKTLGRILRRWPDNGLALVRYGFVLKITGNLTEAVKFLYQGIKTNENGTQESRFYFHLGDALQKMKRNSEAMEVYKTAVKKGIFKSKYQRSLYNVDRLTARPWWTIEETQYQEFFKTLISNWKEIRDEGLAILRNNKEAGFQEESEQLREKGDWRQFEIFSRGTRKPECKRTPVTCRIISDFPPAAGCRRGQVKFSLLEPGTHVWPHCGPTNCRLRAHLGLVVPNNVTIRVAEETRSWKEGQMFVFDDSFEHEIWHNGTSSRLILIVDVWHPELTLHERKTLAAI